MSFRIEFEVDGHPTQTRGASQVERVAAQRVLDVLDQDGSGSRAITHPSAGASKVELDVRVTTPVHVDIMVCVR